MATFSVQELQDKLRNIEAGLIEDTYNIDTLNEYHALKLYILEQELNTDDPIYRHLHSKIKLVDDYIIYKNTIQQKRKIDLLTLINFIFLPLGLIVGYYGMNFGGMGGITKKTGIFTIKYPHRFIFMLFVVSTIVFIFLYYWVH